MSENPPPYPPPPGGQQPSYGPPPGGQQQPPPYGQPAPAYGTPYGPPGQAGFGTPPGGQSKRWYQRWWVWLIIVVAALVIAGIVYGVNHVSGYQLEKKVKEAFSNQGVTVTDVHCPSNVNTDQGSTTSCTGVVNGQTLDIRFDSDRHFVVTSVH